MCDCFHLAFPNWHGSGAGAGRRLRGPEPDDSVCDEPSQCIEGERPRPQGSSPVEEYPEKYTDSDKEGELEHDLSHKGGKKGKKSGFGSLCIRSTPKMSKLEEAQSPEAGVIVKTAKDGCSEGLVVGGGGKDGIFIKEVVPESPAFKNLSVKEGDQILSATVYFDNVSYEDALQILEHAQAYKVKLCLKRKPEITESEPILETEGTQGEEASSPEMRQHGKSKKRSEARISWPKFSSLGRGRKSHFTRSHSTSEAEEQRKLELSPTTSDTESPIKSQDALKGKKKHKIKLSGLRKKSKVSTSVDEETDTQHTTAPVNGTDVQQTLDASPGNSPEHLASPSGETPQVYMIDDPEVTDTSLLKLGSDQSLTEPEATHKVELIDLDSNLKTTDITVALAEQGSPKKSPDSKKKKKKEKSELKMRIMGKDKQKKKEEKAQKRLQTLGASVEITSPSENEKLTIVQSVSQTEQGGSQIPTDAEAQITSIKSSSGVIASVKSAPEVEISMPKVDLSLDMSGVGLLKKSPHTTKRESPKLSVDTGEKHTFKLPAVTLDHIVMEDTIQKQDAHAEELTTKAKRLSIEGVEVKEDPYDRLSKSVSKTQLPKREDIEIPGMEDISLMGTTAHVTKKTTIVTGHGDEIQAETVQLAIDVDSVKEAVSKLPGFKLPKVDMSGQPIPEEITMIDANAQRITVKTPTKVSDVRAKHGTHISKPDMKDSPDILTRTSVKLPKMKPVDLSSHEVIHETRVEGKKIITLDQREVEIAVKEHTEEIMNFQVQKEKTSSPSAAESTIGRDEGMIEETVLPSEKSKKAKIQITGFGIAKPDIRFPDVGFDFPKQNLSQLKGDKVKGDSIRTLETEPKLQKESLPSPVAQDTSPADSTQCVEVSLPQVKLKFTDKEETKKEKTTKLSPTKHKLPSFKLPKFGHFSTKGKEEIAGVKSDDIIVETKISSGDKPKISPEKPESDKTLGVVITAPELQVSVTEKAPPVDSGGTGELNVEQDSTFKLPKLGVSLPKVKGFGVDIQASKPKTGTSPIEAKVKVPEVDTSFPEVVIPAESYSEAKEMEGQGSKFKLPKLGISLPKVKGPEIDLSVSTKTIDVTLPEAKADMQLPDVEIKQPSAEVEIHLPEAEVQVQNLSPTKLKMPADGGELKIQKVGASLDITVPDLEIEGRSKDTKSAGVEIEHESGTFKMPHLGISLPKVKGPKVNLSLSKKDVDVTSREVRAEVQLPDVEVKVPTAEVEVNVSESAAELKDVEGSKLKMPAFKLPSFGGAIKVEVPDMEKDVKLKGPDLNIPDDGVSVDVTPPTIDLKGPSIDVRSTEVELEEKGSKFKMPSLGITMPKVKGPEIDVSLSKKKVDVTSPESRVPTVDIEGPSIDVKGTGDGLGGKGSKFKMPSFGISMPKVKGPEIDLSLSKKDVDVTLPEVKAEVNLPDVDMKEPSAEVEIKAPEIDIEMKDVELKGSSAKFKMPSFKLPKFGSGTPDVTVEVPEVDKEINIEGPEITLPKDSAKIDITLPSVDIEGQPPAVEVEGKGSKFKMPSFGISMPKVKGPEIDLSLSKKDVDVSLPEAKLEVKLPDVEIKEPSAKVEIKAPEVDVEMKDVKLKGSPSKFKMPSFKLPKFGSGTPDVTVEVPEVDKEINIEGPEITLPKDGAKIDITLPSIDTQGPSPAVEVEGKGGKFKMPSFDISMPKIKGPEIDLSLSKKNVDVSLPEAKAEVKIPDVEMKEPSAEVEITAPEIDVEMKDAKLKGSPSKFKMPSFKLPKFGSGTPDVTVEVPEVDKEINIEGPEITLPKDGANIDITLPSVDIEGQCPAVEVEGKGSKFKMPSFGISMPKVKGPEIDLSLSKKNVDVSLPEAKAEVKIPDVEMKEPSAKVEINAPEIDVEMKDAKLKGSPSKFKMPSFKLPKFGSGTPDVTVEVPEVDKEINIEGPEITDGANIDIALPSVDIEGQCPAVEVEGKGSKFKMPSFGISMPKVKGPEIDLSLSKKDVDVSLPEAKLEVKLPDVEIKEPSAKVEIKAPEVDVELKDGELKGSPSKFKMPSFKLPKFSSGTANITVAVPDVDKDVHIDGADITIPEAGASVDVTVPSVDIEAPSIDVKSTGGEFEGKGSKFKMPSFGISMPKVKGPEIDFSLSKKELDVTLPAVNAELEPPNVEIATDIAAPDMPTIETDAKTKKQSWSLPRFSFSKSNVKAPEVDVNLPHVDVSLPEGEVKVKEPELDVKPPEVEVELKDVDGSPTKFKMPTFKLPKFGATVTAEVPEVDKDIKIGGGEMKFEVTEPSIDIEGPSIDVENKGVELEGKGGKFKMPSLGLSMPKVKGPEIDFSLSKKDGDVTLPEVTVEVKHPDVEVKESTIELPTVEHDAKMKKSRFSLPKFSFSKPSVKGPEVDITLPDVDVSIPEGNVEVKGPEVEFSVPEAGGEVDAQGSKFKMPSFGVTLPKVKGPEIDLSLSKKNVEATLPEPKAEVKIPEFEVPEGSASISVPDASAIEVDAKAKKQSWTLPKFSFSKTGVKAPDVDVNLPHVDVSIPEGKVEVKEPEVEIKAPELEVKLKDVDGSPSKFKMPTIKLPKFGSGASNVTVELPEVDKDINIKGPEMKGAEVRASVDITSPSIDIEGPVVDVDVKSAGVELEGKGSRFKMPSLGITMPKLKGPEIDVSLTHKDAKITIPEGKVEVVPPEVEVKDVSAAISVPDAPTLEVDAKMKKQSWSLPRFSFSKPNVKAPEVDVNLPDVDVSIPEGKMKVNEPEMKGPETDIELDGQGSKFKMPSFGISLPKVKGPEIDFSSSKKDVNVTLPEAEAEIKLPDVEIKEPSAKIEIQAPEIEIEMKDAELKGSPSKFKMPSFKLPKFGSGTSNVTAKVPDVDKDIHIEGPEIHATSDGANIDIKVPNVDIEGPSLDVKSTGTELEGKGSKFKMPSFGISMPKVKGPEFDFSSSKKDVDVKLPEVSADISVPEVQVKESTVAISAPEAPTIEVEANVKKPKLTMPRFSFSKPSVKAPDVDVNLPHVDVSIPEGKVEVKEPEVEIKSPEIGLQTKDVDGSPSKFKMPTFKLPKFGITMPEVTAEVPEVDSEINVEEPKIKSPKHGAGIDITVPSVDIEGPSIDVKSTGAELEGKGGKFRLPSLGISMPKVKGPEIDVNASKKDIEVTLPEAKAEIKLPDVETKDAALELPSTDIDIKLKKPRFSLPRFSFAKTSVKEPEVDVNLPDVDVSLPEGDIEIKEPEVKMKAPDTDIEQDGQGIKFKLPGFGISMPKIKGPEIDLSGSKKDVDVTLPEVKADVALPDVEIKGPSAEVEIKAPEIEVEMKDAELKGSPSKFKMPSFKLPKFGVGTPNVTVELPDTNKDIHIEGPEIKAPKDGAKIEISVPSVDIEGQKEGTIELKSTEGELDGKGGKFRMPSFGISMPKVKGPEIDLTLSKKDVDVTLPEVKAEIEAPDVEAKDLSAEPPIIELEPKLKKPRFSLPKFSFSKAGVKEPEVDVNIPDVDASIPEVNVEVTDMELKMKAPVVEVEVEGKESKFKMPSFGVSLPKVKGPEIDINLSKKDVDATLPEAKAEIKPPDAEVPETSISVPDAPALEVDAKMKKQSWSLPKFSFSKPSVKAAEVDVTLPDVNVTIPEGKVDVKEPKLEVKAAEANVELDGQGSKFKMPGFGVSLPKMKGPEIDMSLPKKDVDITLPEAKAEVKIPEFEVTGGSATISVPDAPVMEVDAKAKKQSWSLPKFSFSKSSVKAPEVDVSLPHVDVSIPEGKVEVKEPELDIKSPEIEVQIKDTEGSPSKFKMPTFKLPKFGAATTDISGEVPEVEKDITIKAPELKAPKDGINIDIAAPSLDTEVQSINVKGKETEVEGKGSKFKMPSLSISMAKVKGPEISVTKKDVDATMPEMQTEIKPFNVEVHDPSAAVSVPDIPDIEVEATVKKSSWSMPKFSFSKSNVQAPEVDVTIKSPDIDGTLTTTKAEVNLPDVEIKESSGAISVEKPSAPELEAKLKKPRFSLPKFSFSKSSVKEPETDVKSPEVDVSLPEEELEVKKPEVMEVEVKCPDVNIKSTEGQAELKAVEESPSRFKMPTIKLPSFGTTSSKVTVDLPYVDDDSESSEVRIPKEDAAVDIKVADVNADVSNIDQQIHEMPAADSEVQQTETASPVHGSPSKFKLPSFKMPKLSFSKAKPEDEHVPAPVDAEHEDEQLEIVVEPQGLGKSPKLTLTSFGEILKTIDVEFNVPEVEKLSPSKEEKEKESGTAIIQESSKSPEKGGWMKFPKQGLSSPPEAAPIPDKDGEKSPTGEPVDDDVSTTYSLRSSDAFADISSAMASEQVGLSLSSPTKVTVKYSDPDTILEHGEAHGEVITHTTRTEIISVEPNLPEKITILSSRDSSSSVDTLKLDPGNIHVITSNIQATPESQQATLFTDFGIQEAGGLSIRPEFKDGASWSMKESHHTESGTRTVVQRHVVRETSAESRESVVITKKVTHVSGVSRKPLSGETVSSIQRMKDSVHTEKMKFFEEAKK